MKVKFSDEIYNLKDELVQIKEKYEDKYEELMREVEEKCVRQVYSSGGLMLHRGFYCPSSLDKVCGANRGKIISRKPKQGYIYYFDEKEQLIYVEKREKDYEPDREFLFYEKNEVYSVVFNCDPRWITIHLVTKCVYNPLLTDYIALFPGCEEVNDHGELDIETYEYAGEKILKANLDYYFFNQKEHYTQEFEF